MFGTKRHHNINMKPIGLRLLLVSCRAVHRKSAAKTDGAIMVFFVRNAEFGSVSFDTCYLFWQGKFNELVLCFDST
jgi:hypothetical protein